jgi:hypothetical protein
MIGLMLFQYWGPWLIAPTLVSVVVLVVLLSDSDFGLSYWQETLKWTSVWCLGIWTMSSLLAFSECHTFTTDKVLVATVIHGDYETTFITEDRQVYVMSSSRLTNQTDLHEGMTVRFKWRDFLKSVSAEYRQATSVTVEK